MKIYCTENNIIDFDNVVIVDIKKSVKVLSNIILYTNPRNILFTKIRHTKILNQIFFISTKKVPKNFTNRLNNLAKKNHKKACIFVAII